MSDKPLYASDVVIGGVSLAELAEQLKNSLETAAKIKDFTESRKSRERQDVQEQLTVKINPEVWDNVRLCIPLFNPTVDIDDVIKTILKEVPNNVPSGERSKNIKIFRTDKGQLNNLRFLSFRFTRNSSKASQDGRIRWFESETRLIGSETGRKGEDEETGEEYINAEVEVQYRFFNAIHYALLDGTSEDYILGQLMPFCNSFDHLERAIVGKAKKMMFEDGDYWEKNIY